MASTASRNRVGSPSTSGSNSANPQNSRSKSAEDRPVEHPYFKPEFQEALETGKIIAGKLHRELQKVEIARIEDEHIPRLIKQAIELNTFNSPNVCTIGIVGDSGVGKPP